VCSGEPVAFDTMALSQSTKAALKAAKLVTATEIQAAAIPHASAGRDILGAAKTGSGKTLAFVVPVIEKLFRERWSYEDGLAGIIITPTRELALQIFDVIRTVGSKHQLSAGIVTGGKKGYEMEQEKVVRMNILVATPGRLLQVTKILPVCLMLDCWTDISIVCLQHLEQTPNFSASQLQVLVLDEADRILDLGFRQQLDQILEYLPPRQTMLFSATQTKSVKVPLHDNKSICCIGEIWLMFRCVSTGFSEIELE
jgi:ATP-dependent RNA helicase DDX10/DBP4